MTIDTSILNSSSSEHLNLPLQSIPVVDLRLLSQPELNSLSLCSDNALDLSHWDDVVIPKIDRSLFNESAGSRKQTYSRLRLAPRKPLPALLPPGVPASNPVDDDPETKENKHIISLLRGLFGADGATNNYQPTTFRREEPEPEPLSNGIVTTHVVNYQGSGESMKKRGRKRKAEQNLVEPQAIVAYTDMEIMNKHGAVVDIDALANTEDPFGPELRRRTVGLQTEEALLGFLRGLEGQWGSRRKKRRIVDASEFGDALPVGWKLLLSLKRKDGVFWLNCRRYISPNGQQFASCKEVSFYLLSIFGSQGESHRNSHDDDDESDHEVYELASGSTAGLTYKDENSSGNGLIYHSTSPLASLSSEHERQVALMGTENLAEVEIKDLLECHICRKNFEEKDAYLQHLLSSHQRSAKKSRLGSSICDGVIIKDGKYECQFCHKSFNERRRYNSHVGVHVRNYVRSLETSPGKMTIEKNVEALSMTGSPSQISQVGASVDVEKDSVPPTSTGYDGHDIKDGSPHLKLAADSYLETSATNSNNNLNYSPCEQDVRNPIPQTVTAESGNGNVDSPSGNLGLSSIPEESAGKSSYELNVGSVDVEQEIGVRKLDEISGDRCDHKKDHSDEPSVDEVIMADSNNKFNSPNRAKDITNSSTQTFTVPSNNGSVDSIPGNLGLSSIPDESTAKFSYELTVGSVDCQKETVAKNVDEISCDSSLGKKDNLYETSVDKVIEADYTSNNLNVDFTSCLDSEAFLCNSEISGTFGGKDVSSTTNDTAKPYLEQEVGYFSFLPVASGSEKINDVESRRDEVAFFNLKESKLDEAVESGSNGPETGFESKESEYHKVAPIETIGQADEENMLQGMMVDAAPAFAQSSDCFPTLSMIPDKGVSDFDPLNQKLENVPGFEELRLGPLANVDSSKFEFATDLETNTLPQEPMDLAYNSVLEPGIQFEWETMLPKMDSSQQLTTVCVWCRAAFSHETVDTDMQTDPVGFICPTCKAKFSGQFWTMGCQ